VTRLVFSPGAVVDIERLSEFLLADDPVSAGETGEILSSGLNILKSHPLVGRKTEYGYRELIISRGRTGYIALYKFDAMADTVIVMAIRHQRETPPTSG
jgi:plasmid stabilization system protein ParE